MTTISEMSELIARRTIATGPKGQRKLIEADQRFNPADYPSVAEKEWQAMLQHGIVAIPDEPTPEHPTQEHEDDI